MEKILGKIKLILMKRRLMFAFFLLILGITLLVAGFFRGEAYVVFNKAIRICMECIGIG